MAQIHPIPNLRAGTQHQDRMATPTPKPPRFDGPLALQKYYDEYWGAELGRIVANEVHTARTARPLTPPASDSDTVPEPVQKACKGRRKGYNPPLPKWGAPPTRQTISTGTIEDAYPDTPLPKWGAPPTRQTVSTGTIEDAYPDFAKGDNKVAHGSEDAYPDFAKGDHDIAHGSGTTEDTFDLAKGDDKAAQSSSWQLPTRYTEKKHGICCNT